MSIKILNTLAIMTEDRKNALVVGTHNGIFHSDEVLACAILCLLPHNSSIYILRSRDSSLLSKCDVCVDVGGGKFDHHQAGFSQKRKNGTMYASAGLIWKAYGKELINHIVAKYFSNFTCDTDFIFELFDSSFISLVDCEDNGVKTKKHNFSFISSFLPLWFNNSAEDFNNQFEKALLTTIEVLEQTLKATIGKEIAKNLIKSNWKSSDYFCNGILEISSQTLDWTETVIALNSSAKSNKINFVIFPYPNGGWAAQCVPPSPKKKFNQRIPFPVEWAGQTDKLPEISKVSGSTFCHNGRFFARATSKESIIQMCNIATESKYPKLLRKVISFFSGI